MKSIKIHIKQLGRIKETDIEISPLMVFSGESGFGKSYIAILCHFFFQVFLNTKSLHKFFESNGIDYASHATKFKDAGTAASIQKDSLERWLASEALTYVRYMLGDDKMVGELIVLLPDEIPVDIPITYKKEKAGIQGDEQEDIILGAMDLTFRVRENTDFDESPYAFLIRYALIDKIWGDWKALKHDFIMPPSRGPLLTERITPITGLFQEYYKGLEILNKATMRSSDESHAVLDRLHEILEGEVTREDSSYYYRMGEVTLPISAAAASIREIAPIQFLAQKTDVSKAFVLVEEPEAHLHPLKQRLMADILCCLAKSGTFLQITTHSDYFLHRLNEILLYGKIKQTIKDQTKVDELSRCLNIQDDLCIDLSTIKAYILVARSDGSTYAELQTLDEGVPYSSFLDALKFNVINQELLEEVLNYAD